MKYNRMFRRHYRAGERGVALLFALGILSLLIISVLIFAHRSSVDRKVASAYAGSAAAKDLVQSALNRAILTLQHNSAVGTAFYSYRANGSDGTDYDWLWKLESATVPLGTGCPVQWQYVKDADGHIIGRFAYAVIGQNLMNLNSVARHYCTAGSACPGSSCAESAKRLGNSPSELEFKSSPLFTFNNGTLTRSAVNTLTSYGASPFQNIQDLLTRLNSTSITGSKEPPEVRLNRYFCASASAAQNEPEAWFAGDIDADKQKDKAEFYQRFPLRRTDWNSLEITDITKSGSPAAAFYDGSGNPVSTNAAGIPWLAHWSDTEGNWADGAAKGNQIIANLLNYCSPDSRAVVSDVAPASWSAANVPAYTGNKRTWYLNECAVNVSAQGNMGASSAHNVQISETETMTWYSWDALQLELRIGINPEIIRIYESVIGSSYKVKLLGTVSFQYRTNNYTDIGTTSPGFSLTAPVLANEKEYDLGSGSFSCREVAGDPYKVFCFVKASDLSDTSITEIREVIPVGRFASSSASPSDSEKNALFSITDLKVRFNMMLVRDDAENVDYACLPFPESAAPVVALSASELTDLVSYHYSVDDPRHNLHKEDWHEAGSTLGAVNTFSVSCNYTPADVCVRDPETVSDPAWYDASRHLSTAYIRHAPMESLWELGAIHRAAPWQTLNFKRPNAVSSTFGTDLRTQGGGAYMDGDFRLVDQVATTGWSSGSPYCAEAPYGKINLNAPSSEARKFNFDALFRNMPFSTDGSYTRTTTSAITGETDGWITPSVWLGKLTTPLYRRSDLWQSTSSDFWKLCTTSPVDGSSTLATDALQEQLLCRIINLTKAVTSCDSAIVVALAQSVQDIGNSTEVYIDWDEDGSVGATESTDAALVKAGYKKYDKTDPAAFPAKASVPGSVTASFGHYDLGADRITGEAKLQAYLLYDRSLNRWKLLQVKYEE